MSEPETKPMTIFKYMRIRPNSPPWAVERLLALSHRVALNDSYEFYATSQDVAFMQAHLPPKSVGNFNFSQDFFADGHLNGMGVMSFTETPDNLPMWSHYADEHRGFVIEFDATHDFFRELKQVKYRDNRDEVAGGFFGAGENTFLQKSIDWSYEREWRIFDSLICHDCWFDPSTQQLKWGHGRIELWENKPIGMYFRQVATDAVISVRFGCRAATTEIEKWRDTIGNSPELSHISLLRAKLELDRFALRFEQVSHPSGH